MAGSRQPQRSIIDAILDQVEDKPSSAPKTSELFRAEALDHLDLASDVDSRLKLVSRQSWIAILSVGLMLTCGLVWAALMPSKTTIAATGRVDSQGQMVLVVPESQAQAIAPGMKVEISGTNTGSVTSLGVPVWSSEIRDQLMLALPEGQPVVPVLVKSEQQLAPGTPVTTKIVIHQASVLSHLLDRS